ncbi:MAG: hypothetical protein WBN70_07120, partial [Polyangiales bacterium]
MKYGWIAVVAMMATMLSTGQVAAQDPSGKDYGPEEIGPEESPFGDPDVIKDEGPSELEKLRAMDAGKSAPAPAPAPSGFDPPGQSRDQGMGTQAAERERMRRSVGTVGESVRKSGKSEDAIPLKFQLHGYYRARYDWIGNAPMPTGSIPSASRFPSKNASYGYMRLRIDPEVTYGPNPDLPIARLRFTVDGFDNVVFGDNARIFSAPLFAVDQSYTNVEGFDLRESLKLERAWIEFLVPVGQVRVGRMESQWGMGQLTHAGNGLAEWGEFLRGETFDRILFATRPITLARGISKGDTRQTPLLYAFVYDRLTQDPVVDSTIGSSLTGSRGAATNPDFKPYYTTFPERSVYPLAYLTNLDRRVNEIVNVLAWFDEDFGNGAQDELFAGAYVVYRWQDSTESRIIIPDVAWRLKYTLKDNRKLALYTEGEWHSIFGHSGALSFTLGCPPAPCNRGEAGIHNVMARAGVGGPGKWGTYVEGGWASGDSDILSINEKTTGTPKLTTRGFNTNIKVGLLMYQVALKALGFNALFPVGAEALGPNGSVWNSVYMMPVGRLTIVPGLEVHGQVLVAWASALDPLVYGGQKVEACRLQKDCFMGVEADIALRARIGAKDIIWIDWESGIMKPGQAFTNSGIN